MTDEVVVGVKMLFSLFVTFILLWLSKKRVKENEKYAERNSDNSKKIITRLLLTSCFKWGSIALVWLMSCNKVDGFIAFYVFTPIFIISNSIFFRNIDYMMGIITFIKGFYYLGLTIISIVQFLLKIQDTAEIALGFTLALAIFEGATALTDGYFKIKKYENSKIKK